MLKKNNVVIVGAGAAGLMCAIEAGKRGRNVIVLEKSKKAGKKILMSGGGRCNFTNYNISANAFISHNKHFCKSALSRYTQWNFIELIKKYNIPFYEKTLGQLFCVNKSRDVLDMLLLECKLAGVKIYFNVQINCIKKTDDNSFLVKSENNEYMCESLVVACGGLSIPTMGSSPFGYVIAKQFGIKVWPTSPALVPFTLNEKDKEIVSCLSGLSVDVVVSNKRVSFREGMLFTHRGLSGPSILQISSYWKLGETVEINMLPDDDVCVILQNEKISHSQKKIKSILADFLPKRLVETIINVEIVDKKIAELNKSQYEYLAQILHSYTIKPNGTEGYRTAEVTLGGVDCDYISSKTMEAREVKGLYFIGEVMDVTGWLGGYNFQWAWSSGWAAGQVV